MDSETILYFGAGVVFISVVLKAVLDVPKTVEKHFESDETGSKKKLTGKGKWLGAVAIGSPLFAIIGLGATVYGGVIASWKSSQQSKHIESLVRNVETLRRDNTEAKADRDSARESLRDSQATNKKTLEGVDKLQDENRTVKAKYDDLCKLLNHSSQKTDDVKKLLLSQAQERERRENEEHLAAAREAQERERRENEERLATAKAAHERQLRAKQSYVATFHVPKAQNVSVVYKGPQQKNVSVFIIMSQGVVYELQCEVQHGIQWSVGTTGKDFALTFHDDQLRKTITDANVVCAGKELKFNGIKTKQLNIKFPQEDMPAYEITQ